MVQAAPILHSEYGTNERKVVRNGLREYEDSGAGERAEIASGRVWDYG